MNALIKIAQAAGCDVQAIRLKMQQPDCVFGTAIKKKGSGIYTYIPYPQKVKELFGVDLHEEIIGSGTGTDDKCEYSLSRTSDIDEANRKLRDNSVLLP